jgi:hypothetical protein
LPNRLRSQLLSQPWCSLYSVWIERGEGMDVTARSDIK